MTTDQLVVLALLALPVVAAIAGKPGATGGTVRGSASALRLRFCSCVRGAVHEPDTVQTAIAADLHPGIVPG
jgi:hypothetical protein